MLKKVKSEQKMECVRLYRLGVAGSRPAGCTLAEIAPMCEVSSGVNRDGTCRQPNRRSLSLRGAEILRSLHKMIIYQPLRLCH